MRVTGERIVTSEGGFNASWQRHAACYSLSSGFLSEDTVLDLGCGLGHAHHLLAPRRVIGLDIDHDSLTGSGRETVLADIRRLPFAGRAFGSVLCIHAIEHVPDPRPVLLESARMLKPGGVAIFATPNRLTFGRPDEIIDPYHYVEYDPSQLEGACAEVFDSVDVHGLFGSDRYMDFHAAERRQLNALLRRDPLRLRRFLPRKARRVLYDWKLTRARQSESSLAAGFTLADFNLRSDGLEDALDLIAVCRSSAR
jgi:SAM-dependent methyltransferase